MKGPHEMVVSEVLMQPGYNTSGAVGGLGGSMDLTTIMREPTLSLSIL